MCNLYSLTKGQQAIRDFAGAMRDATGNLPLFPGIFPDYAVPIVRSAPKRRASSRANSNLSGFPTSSSFERQRG
jgi:hypothetical protein